MRWRLVPIAAAVLLAGAPPAHAHLMNSGFGPFYDGLAHPLVVAEDLLPILALALLGGLGGARRGRSVLFALTLSWVAGMAAARLVVGIAPPVWWTGVGTILPGALVAADRRLPLGLAAGLAAVVGATHGLGNGRELATVAGGAVATVGVACALFTLASLVAGQVAVLRAPWARIVVRVAGSWIAAIGLLMLGWALR